MRRPGDETSRTEYEFSGLKGRIFAWALTSPLRRVLDWKMGKPEERIFALLCLDGGERVLDAGCGSGFHSLLLAEKVPRGSVVSVDISPEMLDRLRRNAARRGLSGRIEVLHADGLELPLPDASVDRAMSAAVWHHLDDPARACAELARVLRTGGRAVVSDLYVRPDGMAVQAPPATTCRSGPRTWFASWRRRGCSRWPSRSWAAGWLASATSPERGGPAVPASHLSGN